MVIMIACTKLILHLPNKLSSCIAQSARSNDMKRKLKKFVLSSKAEIFGRQFWHRAEHRSYRSVFFFFLVRRLLVPELFRLMYRSFCNTFSTYYFILPIITIALCGTRIRIRKYTTANNKRKLLWRPPNGYDFGTTRNCANERAICLFAIFSSAVMLMCARWPASRLPGYARLSIMTSTISYNLALRVSTTFSAA